jgi:hypothetical protein
MDTTTHDDSAGTAYRFDPLGPRAMADPGTAYSELRERCPFHHHKTERHDRAMRPASRRSRAS